MNVFNPEKYEYLWTDHDVDFIFTSCYLFENFKKTDFILIYNWKDKGLRFYFSKKDLDKYADYGLIFYKNISDWKKEINKIMLKGEKLVKQSKEENTKRLNDSKIRDRFKERVELFQKLGNLYFYTEFFFSIKIEQNKEDEYKDNMKQVGKVKFRARKLLNDFYNHSVVFKPYIDEIALRKNRSDLRWLSFNEILQVIDDKKVPLSKRENNYWMIAGEYEIIGKEAEKIMKLFDNYFSKENEDVLRGVVANKGKAKGKAAILKTIFGEGYKKEIQKVKEGNILIAETTGPEIIPAMKKASAFVTDEGGLTSHAAIVAREMGKPCIVGTKHATKIFKDGDLVEVDADKGVVRKIN